MHRCLAQTVLFLSGKLKYIILEVMNMRKMLKENKGFSLVELLVAILIMAVIAGTAITLFGGVLNSSRKNADNETAESIKRAVLTYMNSTNDVDLSCLGVASSGTSSEHLIRSLGLEIDIHTTGTGGVRYTRPGGVSDTQAPFPTTNISVASSDIKGKFGPFLDASKDMTAPTTPGTIGWRIEVDKSLQVVVVTPVDSGSTNVEFRTGTSSS